MPDKLAVLQTKETIKELDALNKKLEETVALFTKMSPQIEAVNSLFSKGTPKEYTEALKKTKELEEELEKVRKSAQNTHNQKLQLAKKISLAMSEEGKEVERLKTKLQSLNKENKQHAKDVLGMITPYQKFAQQVLEAKNKAKDLEAEMLLLEQRFKNGLVSADKYKKEINRLSNEFVEAKLKATGLDTQLKNIDKNAGDSHRNVGNYKSALNGLSISFKTLLAGFGVSMGIEAFTSVLKSSYETIKALNAQNYALKEVFETEAQVAFQKEYLTEISKKYGLELVSTTEAYTKFSAAIKGTSVEGEEGRKIFTAFAGASSKLGLSAKEQEGIFKALEQMMSKGKIQAEELRGQLGDRMSGAFRLFADAIGVSTAELDKMLKDGEVFSNDVLPKVAEELEKQYNLAENTDTLAAAQNRLSTSWTQFLDRLAGNKDLIDIFTQSFKGLEEALDLVLTLLVGDELDESKSLFMQLWEVVNLVFGILKELGIEQTDLANITKTILNVAVMTVKGSLETFKLVVLGVIDVIKDLGYIIQGLFTGDWGNAFDRLGDRMKKFTSEMTNIVKDFDRQVKKVEDPEKYAKEERDKKHKKAILDGRKNNQKYVQFEGEYYDTKTGKPTGKSLDDYIDTPEGLVKKKKKLEKPIIPEEPGKGKKYTGAKISGRKKDALDNITAERDNAIANLQEKKLAGEISEVQFQEGRIKALQNYATKIQALLNKNNAKENKISAEQRRKALEEQAKAYKEIYNHKKKHAKALFKDENSKLNKRETAIQNDEFITETERVTQLLALNEEEKEITKKHYEELLKLAKEYHQDEADITTEAKDKMNRLEEQNIKLLKDLKKASETDLAYRFDLITSAQKLNEEEQKALIIADKKLSKADKEHLLKILELETQKKINEEKIKELNIVIATLSAQEKLTKEEAKRLADAQKDAKSLENDNAAATQQQNQLDYENLLNKLKPIRESLSNIFNNLGLESISDEFNVIFDNVVKLFDDIEDAAGDRGESIRKILAASFSVIAEFGKKAIEEGKNRRIAQIDEEIKRSSEQTDMELDFINKRLEAYSNMTNLTAEQIEERNALEDEAWVAKEQQEEREKTLNIRKAQAEQKAQAQQALIDGASGAVKTIAKMGYIDGWPFALASLAFGALQSAIIQSRNPIPKYFVGRKGGKKEIAWTQEKGAEIITDKYGKIKTLGTDKGATLTQLEQGDIVYTASQTKNILKDIGKVPVAGNEVFKRIAMRNITPVNIPKERIDYDKLAQKIGEQQERVARKYDKPAVYEENGLIYKQEGGRIPVVIGRSQKRQITIKLNKNERD